MLGFQNPSFTLIRDTAAVYMIKTCALYIIIAFSAAAVCMFGFCKSFLLLLIEYVGSQVMVLMLFVGESGSHGYLVPNWYDALLLLLLIMVWGDVCHV